jgi:hypothetical protein
MVFENLPSEIVTAEILSVSAENKHYCTIAYQLKDEKVRQLLAPKESELGQVIMGIHEILETSTSPISIQVQVSFDSKTGTVEGIKMIEVEDSVHQLFEA